MVHHLAPLVGAFFLLAGALTEGAGWLLDKAYQIVMVREVVTFGRDCLVVVGLGHVLHIQHRRLRRRRCANRRKRS